MTKKKIKKWVPARVHTRSIDRSVAKHNLGENAHRAIKSGHFAMNWRKYSEQ